MREFDEKNRYQATEQDEEKSSGLKRRDFFRVLMISMELPFPVELTFTKRLTHTKARRTHRNIKNYMMFLIIFMKK